MGLQNELHVSHVTHVLYTESAETLHSDYNAVSLFPFPMQLQHQAEVFE